MRPPTTSDGEPRLELIISRLLIAGVITSLVLEATGMALFYRSYGNLNISHAAAMFIQGHDFFSFIGTLFSGGPRGETPLFLMTLGVIVLMLTPLVRVISAVVYFAAKRNLKYVVITVVVLAALTVSLILH
jgi:uncharacterized membrane protein